MVKYTTVNLKHETKEILDHCGRVNDSYDSLIRRLLHNSASWYIAKNELTEEQIQLIENRGKPQSS